MQIKKLKKSTGLVFLVLSAAAVACAYKAMPPQIIQVSWLDLAKATVQGYSNPLNAAMLKSLDEAGESLYGAENWKRDGAKGYVTFQTPSLGGAQGNHAQYLEKECDEKAADRAPKGNSGNTASGGGGGYSWYGGGVYNSGSCIYGSCGTVSVGDPEQAEH